MNFLNFFKKLNGNKLIVILCAVLGVILAVTTAFLTLKGIKTADKDDNITSGVISNSSVSSAVSEEQSEIAADDSSVTDSSETSSQPVIAEVGVVMSNPLKKTVTVTEPQFTFVGKRTSGATR